MSELLKAISTNKRNPEFADAVDGITHALRYADKMHKAGKLTKSEFEDFEAHQFNLYIDALPPDEFHEMMQDGRLTQLQAMAGHDGSRDNYGVDQDRKSVSNKIKAEALEEAWLSQKIDAKRYAEEMREISPQDDKLESRLADKDYDGVAAERFAGRHDAPKDHKSDFEKIFADYMPKGDRQTGPKIETKREAGRHDNGKYEPPAKETAWEGIIDHDAQD